MKTNTSNLKHFLVIFLVAITCLFGTSSCLTALLISAAHNAKQQSTDDNQGPKPIPGVYDYSSVSPSGQRLYYRIIDDASNKYAVVINPNLGVQRGDDTNVPNYLSGVVVVPEKINVKGEELPVVSIGRNAFYGCNSVTAIVLPKTINDIGESAFFETSELKTIIMYSKNPPRNYMYSKHTPNRTSSNSLFGSFCVVCQVPKESMKEYCKDQNYKENPFIIAPILDDYDIYNGGSIEEYFERTKDRDEQCFKAASIVKAWGQCDPRYDFISISPNGQPLCYTILEDGKTVMFIDPKPKKGNYVNGNVIIPPTVKFNGKEYPVTKIMRGGLTCKGATSYFIPNTISYIDDNYGLPIVGESASFVVCYATTPPQLGFFMGCVVQVPKGCLDKYKTAETWSQQPELIMEVGDDFQQYLDEGRIDEYMEKAKNSINFDQMWAAQRNFYKKKIEQQEKEKQAIEEQREKKEQAQWKKEVDQLKKQYGAKYVNDLLNNGKLVIGMPIGLVRYGLQNRLFKRFTSMSLDSQTATREVYDLYRFNPSDILTYKVGWISFTNGKVSSIHWY